MRLQGSKAHTEHLKFINDAVNDKGVRFEITPTEYTAIVAENVQPLPESTPKRPDSALVELVPTFTQPQMYYTDK